MPLIRRHLTVFAAVLCALLVGAFPAGATPWANDNGLIPYGPSSLLQATIPADAPVSPDNAAFVAWEKANEPVGWWRVRGASGTNYGENFGRGVCADPVFKMVSTGNTPRGQEWLKTTGFHAPQATFEKMTQSNDNPVVIQDSCVGTTVWMANVFYDGTTTLKSGADGNITGGSFAWGTNGLDYRAPSSDSADYVNSVSRGRIPDSMFARDYNLSHPAADGTLGYALEVFFMETNSYAGFQEPMTGAESGKAGCGGSAHPSLCAEGQYVRINPNINLAARPGCIGPALVLAKTLQLRGGYIGDNSGSGSGVKGEQGTTVLGKDALKACMTYDDLQILAKGYVPPHT